MTLALACNAGSSSTDKRMNLSTKGHAMNLSRRLQSLLLASAVAVIALVAQPVKAATPMTTDYPRSVGELMKMKPMAVMHMMDTDKKGVVTKDEYMKFFTDLWTKMDKENKGEVTKDEWMTGWARNK